MTQPPLSPALFLASAISLLPRDKTVESQGELLSDIDPAMRDNHRPADRVKSAAFIGHVGYWAHWARPGISMWPFPVAADCRLLAKLAERRRILHEDTPNPGEILLRWSLTADSYVRASIVVEVRSEVPTDFGAVYECEVIEGYANRIEIDDESEWRSSVSQVRRTIRYCCPQLRDRFIAWVDLDRRNELGKARKAA